jgi:serine/threonine-protein kinase
MPEPIGPYDLHDEIGVGAMGTVYRATDTRTGETVALKVLHPHLMADPDAIARLDREARIAGRLDHPNIVKVLDHGQDGRRYYIAMEYIDGETLGQRLRREGRLTEAETARIALAVAGALAAAHEQGVIHRDIKPSNILIARNGAVFTSDFSVARAVGYTTVTQVGAFVGTPAYAAPEAIDGKPDIRTDLYSLGVVMYQMLVGRLPFDADSPAAALKLQRSAQPDLRPLRVAAPALAPVVARLLEKEPRKRYADPAALATALGALPDMLPTLVDDATLDAMTELMRPAGWGRTLTTWRNMPRAARIGGAGIIITALSAGGMAAAALAFGGGTPPPPATTATPSPSMTGTRTMTPTRTYTATPTGTQSPTATPKVGPPSTPCIGACEPTQPSPPPILPTNTPSSPPTNTPLPTATSEQLTPPTGTSPTPTATFTPAPPVGNVACNASFETSEDCWSLTFQSSEFANCAPVLVGTTQPRSGGKALEFPTPPLFQGPGSGTACAREARTRHIPIVGGYSYSLTFYVFTETDKLFQWQVAFYEADQSTQCDYTPVLVTYSGALAWQATNVVVDAPSCAAFVSVSFADSNLVGPAATTSAFIDDVDFRVVP